ncbi:hypothetical protein Dimus_019912 [Dionaea muscipula]
MGEESSERVVGGKVGHRMMTKPQEPLVSHQRFGLLSVDSGETLEDTDAQRMIRLWAEIETTSDATRRLHHGDFDGLSARIEEA